jgi:RHS repeat-associated protein
LPKIIGWRRGTIENHYTFDGQKLGKKVYDYRGNLTLNERYFDELLMQNGKVRRLQHADGYISLTQDGNPVEYFYYLKDHLGNIRATITQATPDSLLITQANDYYPFGMAYTPKLTGLQASSWNNKFKYNGKEEQEMPGGWLDYGARFYDPTIARFTTSDPLAEVAYVWTPYRYGYNNPMKYTDPTGMLESTHTDEEGNVIAVYDDGDNGVYKHEGKGDEAAKTVEQSYSEDNTSAGGEKMGESLHSLSFADQSVYNETGEVKAADIKIDFGSTELTDKVQGILDADPSLIEYAGKAGTNGDWDLKSNTSNGSLLYGKYASPRDAGNFAAGAVAQMSGIEPIAQFGFGAYNMTGNSKPLTGLVTGAVGALTLINPAAGLGAATLIGKYGEDKLSQRSIDIGKQYIKNK